MSAHGRIFNLMEIGSGMLSCEGGRLMGIMGIMGTVRGLRHEIPRGSVGLLQRNGARVLCRSKIPQTAGGKGRRV